MKNEVTEKKDAVIQNDVSKAEEQPQEIRGIVQPSEQKPANPKWWDIMGWVLRFVVALAALLKLLKDK